jgi:glucose-1-phosphate cytidylyltransferase
MGSWAKNHRNGEAGVRGRVIGNEAMKVVLFCGGLGTRLREHSDTVPKPLVNIGNRPIIWHLMRYYAHYGHTDFILCLGYRGDMIRDYFLHYSEALSNDFTLSDGGRKIELHKRDLDNWRITFVDTGLHSNIGQRLLRVRRYLGNEEMFLANYSDGLSDLPLDRCIEQFTRSNAIASFASVRSSQSFHVVQAQPDGLVTNIGALPDYPLWINGGFFTFRRWIFDYVKEGEELVEQPFSRLIAEKRLITFHWQGHWQCMDTFKDKITFDRMEARDECPWMVWRRAKSSAVPDAPVKVPLKRTTTA